MTIGTLLLTMLCLQGASAGELRPIYPRQVTATSMLRSDWNKYEENYHPNYVADDNPATAWVEGVEGDGAYERLRLELSSIPKARALHVSIRNGYQKSDKLLEANAAPEKVRVTLFNGPTFVSETEATLRRTMGWQEIIVPVEGGRTFNAVQIVPQTVHPGSKYADLCISDVSLRLDSDQPYRAAVENANRQAVLAWIAGRQQQAALNASKPARYPFVGAQSRAQGVHEAQGAEAEALKAELLKAEQRLDALLAAPDRARPIPGRTFSPPDGLEELAPLMAFFDREGLKFEPAAKRWDVEELRSDDHPRGEGGWVRSQRSNVAVVWADAAMSRVKSLAWQTLEVGEERVSWRTQGDYALIFDDKGRPKRAIVRSRESAIEFNEGVVVYDFETDAGGRIRSVRRRSLGWYSEVGPGRAPPATLRAHRSTVELIGEL